MPAWPSQQRVNQSPPQPDLRGKGVAAGMCAHQGGRLPSARIRAPAASTTQGCACAGGAGSASGSAHQPLHGCPVLSSQHLEHGAAHR